MRKKTKFLLLRVSIILAFALLSGRIWYIQVVMGSYYRSQADTSKIRFEPVQALRGIIYDRNGQQLVYNTPSWTVGIVPHGIPAERARLIYAKLSSLLHYHPSASRIAALVASQQWRPYSPVTIKSSVSSDTAMVIKQLHTQLPGVRADPTSTRQYVQGLDSQWSLSHILGYAGKINPDQYAFARRMYPSEHFGATDEAGRDGVESAMDQYLHGVNGTQQVEVDAGERPIRTLRRARTVPGDSVYLTINWKLQQQVSQDLQAALDHLKLRRGVAVVENVHTGEILSMVSLPSFNNNWFSGSISQKHYDSLLNDPAHPLTNLATSGQFPPGSTYKVVTAAAALQLGVADQNRYIQDTGSIKLCSVYDPRACQTFFGWNAAGLGSVNVVGALSKSSDIYFYTVAGGNPNIDPHMPKIGATRLARIAKLFGLGRTTGIELPGEMPGNIPDPASFGNQWHIGDTYNMAIGQGYNDATPLQMANITATIANGGTMYRPRIIQRVVGRVLPRLGALARGKVVQPFVPQIIRQNFISPANIQLIQEGMHGSVTPNWDGTSYYVWDPRIDAAGKTGTAEATGGPHAWWIGYAPYRNPQIAVCVMVPNANSEGAYVAAPIAHKIFEDYFHLKPSKPNWLDDVQYNLASAGAGSQ